MYLQSCLSEGGREMKKIKFYLGTGYAGCYHEEIFEYEDNVSEEEIKLDASWWKLED